MSYIYHLKPEPMEGNELIPLNLMDHSCKLYKEHARKYEGREELMEEIIPILNCRWNDVVQFSALNPQVIVNELKKIQPDLKLLRSQYYKVHVDQIKDNYQAVVFDRQAARKEKSYGIDENEVLNFKDHYSEIFEVPQATLNCWEKAKAENGKLLWFPFVPHVFVKGRIDVSDFEICDLSL